jgi:hypothetical protein
MLSTADEETSGVIQWMIANHFAEIDAEYVLDEVGGIAHALAAGKLAFGIGRRKADAVAAIARPRDGGSWIAADSRQRQSDSAGSDSEGDGRRESRS